MDYISNNNFRGLTLVKKLAKSHPEIVPSGINLDDALSCTPDNKELQEKTASANNYADEILKEYPINSAKNTWLSAVYFYTDGQFDKTASVYNRDAIETNIHLASEAYGIGETVDALCSVLENYVSEEYDKLDTQEKCASTEKYAYSDIDESTGNIINNYLPVNTLEQIYDSAKQLAANKDKIPAMIFKRASENLVKEFSYYSEEEKHKAGISALPESVKRAGVKYLIDPAKLKQLAEFRYLQTKDDMYQNIGKFASYKKSNEDLSIALDFLCERDIINGLHSKYGNAHDNVLNPYEATASHMTEEDAIKLAKSMVPLRSAFVPFEVLQRDDIKQIIKSAFKKEASERIINAIEANNADAISFSETSKLTKNEEQLLLDILMKKG